MSHPPTIHWLGAGLSSPAGIHYLTRQEAPLTIWNRTPSRAESIVGPVHRDGVSVRELDWDVWQESLAGGDVVVSMLPADQHPQIAERCLEHHCHLVTASYLSKALEQLHSAAQDRGLCFVNESGLDPGLDHLFAHDAVEALRQTPLWEDPTSRIEFASLCGGLSKTPNPFRYRFSWSPIGVLRALQTPATLIQDSHVQSTPQPWSLTEAVEIAGETFETYPNRDSLPYVKAYRLDHFTGRIDSFVRGSLRLAGWQAAWAPILKSLPELSETELGQLSQQLWEDHALPEGQYDRVVLYVCLRARSAHHGEWESHSLIDHVGDQDHSAMARLVSLPAAHAALAVRDGRIEPGVHSTPAALAERRALSSLLAQEGISTTQTTSWRPWPSK